MAGPKYSKHHPATYCWYVAISFMLIYGIAATWPSLTASAKSPHKHPMHTSNPQHGYLSFCVVPESVSDRKNENMLFQNDYFQPDGQKIRLSVSRHFENVSHCAAHQLPFAAEQVAWAGIISTETAQQFSQGIILEGSIPKESTDSLALIVDNASPLVEEKEENLPPAVAATIPKTFEGEAKKGSYLRIGDNLLNQFTATAFGMEERVSIEKNEHVVEVRCRAGKQPAGVLFKSTNRFPKSATSLQIRLTGNGHFQWAISDQGHALQEQPLTLGEVEAGETLQLTNFILPSENFNPRLWDSFSLLCPNEESRLTLSHLSLAGARPIPRQRMRSGWIWEPQAWQKNPNELFDILADWEMKRVYISIPINEADGKPEAEAALKSFIAQASERGIQVWAVDGDRYALLPNAEAAYLKRAHAYALYNQTASAAQKISGIQYDIEPYLMQGYALESSQWNQRYVAFLSKVKNDTDLSIEIAVPFWFNKQKIDHQRFLDKVAASIDSIAVMDYRTDEAEIKHFAQPFLNWGERYGKSVTIALETVYLPDNVSRVYRVANQSPGSLWLWEKDDAHILILLKNPVPKLPEGTLYTYSHTSTSSRSNTTFYGHEDKLREMLKRLEAEFGKSPAFAGLAIHGTDQALHPEMP